MAAATAPEFKASDNLDALPRAPATSVKTLGWRGVMQTVHREGAVLVTNHDRPEAVILSPEAYLALARAAGAGTRKDADVLEALRARFDARLAALQDADAGDRLRAVIDAPAKLHGKAKAGAGH